MGIWIFLGIKWPGRGVDHPPLYSAEIKEKEDYTSTPSLGLPVLFWGF
jgi:hypothetical protein